MNRIAVLLLFLAAHVSGQAIGNGKIYGGTLFGASGGGGSSSVSSDLATSMIACWPLDEASGTREDDFGVFDLTDNNTVTGTTGPVGLGNASSFALANSEYLSRADNVALRTGDFSTTFVAWANLTSNPGILAVLSKDNNTAGSGYLLSHNSANSTFRFLVKGASDSKEVSATGTYAPGSGWHFIVCGYDKPNARIFISVDDNADATLAFTGAPVSGTEEFRIGDRVSPSSFWNGGIAGVALWSRLLTATERTALYASGNGTRACP